METPIVDKYIKDEAKSIQKLKSILNEERWTKIHAKDVPLERFRRLDSLIEKIEKEGTMEDAIEILRKHLEEYPSSIVAPYILGLFGYKYDIAEYTHYIGTLIETFKIHSKWQILEMLSEKVLEFGESTIALKSLALALEKLRREKEALPILESIVKLDFSDVDIPYKLYKYYISEDEDKALRYLKQAIERAIHQRDAKRVVSLFLEYYKYRPDDLSFMDLVEKSLYAMKERDKAVEILKMALNDKYSKDIDVAIDLCKRILNYHPRDREVREKLISLYKEKYKNHSLLGEFLKLSNLENFRRPVKPAIDFFEKCIVFDIGKHVFHRTWGLGVIKSIDKEKVIIDFENKKGHRMTLSMALKSLTPLPEDHILVLKSEKPEELKKMFKENPLDLLEIILKSYKGKATISDFKKEIIPFFISQNEWSKWWSSVRNLLKKDRRFRQSPRKRDEYLLRDKPVSIIEEHYDDFVKSRDFSKKVQIAQKLLSLLPTDDMFENITFLKDIANYFAQYEKKKVPVWEKLLSHFIVDRFNEIVPNLGVKTSEDVRSIIKNTDNIGEIVVRIDNPDIKKHLIKLIKSEREDWDKIYSNMLYETPIKMHKFIFSQLVAERKYKEINEFIQNVISGYKSFVEVFLWVARNLLLEIWDYEWLEYSEDELILNFFRLLRELDKIETKGVKLKNQALDILRYNDYFLIKKIASEKPLGLIRKVYEMIMDTSYISDDEKDKIANIMKSLRKELATYISGKEETVEEFEEEGILITEDSYNRLREEFNRIYNVELPNVAKQISHAREYGDLRENAEYKAALEKQSLLQARLAKLQEDLKKVKVVSSDDVDTSKIGFGTKVKLLNLEDNEVEEYVVLGIYEADPEKGIISYMSPFGRSMIGKKVGDKFEFRVGNNKRSYEVLSIEKGI